MRPKLEKKLELLGKYPAAVKKAIMSAKTDEEMVDVLGTVMSNRRRVDTERRLAASEITPTAAEHTFAGERHSVSVNRSANRSFSTPALMKLLQDNGFTLLDLLESDVLRVSWRWTELKNFAERRDIKLDIVDKEIPELGEADGPHVGEYWTDGNPTWK